MTERPGCCVCPPGDCLTNPADPDALVCGVVGCSVCLNGCPNPPACCSDGRPTLPTPEIAAALQALEAVDPQHAATLAADIDYLLADRVQWRETALKYNGAVNQLAAENNRLGDRVQAATTLAGTWDTRAATDIKAMGMALLRDCARELRAALDGPR